MRLLSIAIVHLLTSVSWENCPFSWFEFKILRKSLRKSVNGSRSRVCSNLNIILRKYQLRSTAVENNYFINSSCNFKSKWVLSIRQFHICILKGICIIADRIRWKNSSLRNLKSLFIRIIYLDSKLHISVTCNFKYEILDNFTFFFNIIIQFACVLETKFQC